jgi:hypothetical protein
MTSSRGAGRLGEGSICPHCGAMAGVTAEEGGYICLVCGGPVIVVEDDIARPHGERAFLERAKTLRARRAAWTIGGSLVGAFALVAAALAIGVAAFVDLGVTASIALGAVVLIPLVIAVLGWRKATADGRHAREAMAEAQRIVAGELLGANPNMTSADLAKQLRVTEDAALELMAHAQVTGLLSPASESNVKFRVDGTLTEPAAGEAAPTQESPVARRTS